MSLLGNIGSSVAAKDIRAKVVECMARTTDLEVRKALDEVVVWCDEIIRSADAGWY